MKDSTESAALTRAVRRKDLGIKEGRMCIACSSGFKQRIVLAVFILVALTAGWSALPAVRFQTAVFPIDETVADLVAADVNGDGRCDLIASCCTGRMSVFVQTQNGFSAKPSQTFPLDRGGIFFQAADVNGDSMAELVFLTETGVYKKTWSGDSGFVGWAPIALSQTIFHQTNPYPVSQWAFVRNLDSTASLTILIPKAGWMETYVQDDSGQFVPGGRLWIEPEAALSFGRAPTFSLRLPQLQTADFNGDGLADLLAVYNSRLDVFFRQGFIRSRGDALIPPDLRFRFDIDNEEGGMLETGDFNGDGRIDIALVRESRSVHIHLNKGNRFDPVPDRILTADRMAMACFIRDFNGDGLADVAFVELGLGLKNLFHFVFSQKIQKVLKCHFSRPDGSHPAEADYRMEFKQAFRIKDPLNRNAFLCFDGDFNGDGLLDMAAGTGSGTVNVFPRLPGGGYGERAASVIGVEESAAFRVKDLNGDAISDLLVWHPSRTGFTVILSQRRD